MFIYIIVNSSNLKIYVGQHKGDSLQKYLQQKFSHARRGISEKSHLYAAMRKHPKEVWSIHPLLSGIETREECNFWEKHFIRVLKTQHPGIGYNICNGGAWYLLKHSDETREKMRTISRVTDTLHKFTPEERERGKQACIANLTGVPRPAEVMEKFHAPEVRARAIANSVAANKGKPKPKDVRERMSESKRKDWATRKVRTFSKERNEKISKTMSGWAPVEALKKAHSPETEAKRQLTRFLKTVAWG